MLEQKYERMLRVIQKTIHPELFSEISVDCSTLEEWQELYQLAEGQGVASWLYPVLERAGDGSPGAEGSQKLPAQVMAIFKSTYDRSLRCEAIVDYEVHSLLDSMRAQGIDAAPLKGWLMKELYPSPELRTMSDVDILVREEQFSQACACAQDSGYERHEETRHHIAYRKKPVTQVEIHNKLFDEQSLLYPVFSDIWNRMEPGESGEFHMSPEDRYLYLFAHMAKHFVRGGAGIRNVIDIYLFRRAYADELKRRRREIDAALERVGLKTFERKLAQLAEGVFSGADRTEEEEGLLRHILAGGLYGTMENKEAALVTGAYGNKFSWLLHELFPSRDEFRLKFQLKKPVKPWQVPYYWLRLMLRGVFKRRKKMLLRAKTLTRSRDDFSEVEGTMRQLGIQTTKY